jgi:hypothetical protein
MDQLRGKAVHLRLHADWARPHHDKADKFVREYELQNFVDGFTYEQLVPQDLIMEHQKALHAESQINGVKAAVSGWTDNELQGLRWQLGGAALDRIKTTMLNTTQSAIATHTAPLMRHMAARFRWLRHPRLSETVCTDDVFGSCSDIHGYNGCSDLFGEQSKMLNIYPFKKKSDFATTYKDVVRDEGTPSVLHSDRAPEILGIDMKTLHREWGTRVTTTEADSPWQNPAETQIINRMKTFGRMVMEISGAPPHLYIYAWMLFAYAHNRTSQPALNNKTPIQKRHGQRYQNLHGLDVCTDLHTNSKHEIIPCVGLE